MANQPDPLLTPAEVGQLFRVAPKTVTRWAKAGRLGSIRTLGGHRRYSEPEVQALLRGEPTTRHSVGVEPLTDELRRLTTVPDGATLAVVERSSGQAVKVCTTDAQANGVSIEDMARSYARTYGATYVSAVKA